MILDLFVKICFYNHYLVKKSNNFIIFVRINLFKNVVPKVYTLKFILIDW